MFKAIYYDVAIFALTKILSFFVYISKPYLYILLLIKQLEVKKQINLSHIYDVYRL